MKGLKTKKPLQKSARGVLRRTINDSQFWRRIALQQQMLLHAKNKT